MINREPIKLAIDALRGHKLRSFLTLLGVIIGVAMVIAVVSVIQGLNDYATSRIMEFGSTSFNVSKFSQGFTSMDDFARESRRKNLTLDDLNAVARGCVDCQLTAGVFSENKTLKHKGLTVENCDLRGVTVEAPFIGQVMELQAGRHFAAVDVDHSRYEAIIGADVADRLFPTEDPIGKELLIDGHAFIVLGVAAKTGEVFGRSQDTFVRIPITVFARMYNTTARSLYIEVQSSTPEQMHLAMDETRVVLRNRLHRMYKDDDGFSIASADTFLDLWKQTTGSIFMVTIALASIALVVGGVVLMNIMLVSVTERTREIGVRKALGAKRSDILGQFLAESVLLAGAGGVLGVMTGLLVAFLVSVFSPLPMAVRLWAILLGVGVASSIGLFFGIYPAHTASKLDPVVALRAE